MLLAVAWAVLAAAPSPAPVFKLGSPGLSYVNLEQKLGDFYLDYFTQQVATHEGMQVTTAAEIAATLGFERQKALLGCAEESCTAELAGALGVDGLLLGSLAKAGGGFVANLKVVRARDSSTLAVFSSRLKDESALLDFLGASASTLAMKLLGQKAPALPPPSSEPAGVASGPPSRAWIPAAAVGGVLLVGAGVFFADASASAATLGRGDASIATFDDAAALRRRGQAHQALTWALATGGVLALANAGALLALPPQSSLRRWLPGLSGVACLIAGAVLAVQASSDAQLLASGSPSIAGYAAALEVRADGTSKEAAAYGLFGAGALGVAGTAALLLGAGAPPPVAVIPLPNGAVATLRFEL